MSSQRMGLSVIDSIGKNTAPPPLEFPEHDEAHEEAHDSAPPAPHYRPADRPGENCASCRAFDNNTSHCRKFGFQAEATYTCDGFTPKDFPDVKEGCLNPLLLAKAAAAIGSGPGPSAMSPISPAGGTPQPQGSLPSNSGWVGGVMPGTDSAAMQSGAQGLMAQLRKQTLGSLGAQPQSQPQLPPGVPPQMAQAQQAAQQQSQGQPMPPKTAAVHANGDPKPKGWNGHVNKPTKAHGGVTSFGDEAWETTDRYRRKDAVNAPPPSRDKLAAALQTPLAFATLLGVQARANLERRALGH
jgi:hypothetical protein